MELELRMYGLVNYQLTGIQQGIQFLHGVVEYGEMAKEKGRDILEQYNKWANIHKTVILLNGGTTNNNLERLGTLNQNLQTLIDKQIICSKFEEPDLGDQITSVVFLIDERVFNKEKYPDFVFDNQSNKTPGYGMWSNDPLNPDFINKEERKRWEDWVESIGGETNLWLRSWLKQFRLA